MEELNVQSDSDSNILLSETNTYQNLQLSQDEYKWFAIYTKFKREKMVAKQLIEKGIETYLPLNTFKRYYTRKIKTVQIPLISCYVFVKIIKSEYMTVLETQDVVKFLKFSNDLLAIPEREIKIIRAITGQNMEVETSIFKPELGDEVEIGFGNLYGLRGKLVDLHNGKNVVIELEQMGLSMRIHIDPQYLKILSKTNLKDNSNKKGETLLNKLL